MRWIESNSLVAGVLTLFSSVSAAQDLGNGLAFVDHAVGNVATLTATLGSVNLQQTLDVTASTVDVAVSDLTDGTPLDGGLGDVGELVAVADLSGALGDSLPDELAPQIPVLAEVDRLLFVAPLLGDGIPLISGEKQMLTLVVEGGLGLDLGLTPVVNEAIKVDLLGPGDNDGGGVLLGGSGLGGLDALPLEGLALTGLPLSGDLVPLGVLDGNLVGIIDGLALADLPLSGDLVPVGVLDGDVIGSLSGLNSAGAGLPLDAVPLDLAVLDVSMVQALVSGASLPGL